MDGYLIASLVTHLEISSCDMSPPQALGSSVTINHLDDISHSFVKHVIAVPTDEDTEVADHMYNCHRALIPSCLTSVH